MPGMENSGPRTLSDVDFLTVGQTFKGQQKMEKIDSNTHTEQKDTWNVKVTIQSVQLDKGTLSGTMEALDIPKANNKKVITYWVGEIVDNVNYKFRTMKWNAKESNDTNHWRKFKGFSKYDDRVCENGGDSIDLSQSNFVFMRWKEIYFIDYQEDCGLTISGFYYLCMHRLTGAIRGFYFEPTMVPFQKLVLNPVMLSGGHATATYSYT